MTFDERVLRDVLAETCIRACARIGGGHGRAGQQQRRLDEDDHEGGAAQGLADESDDNHGEADVDPDDSVDDDDPADSDEDDDPDDADHEGLFEAEVEDPDLAA